MKKETTRKICLNCGHEFTYREKLQSMYRFWWRMKCKACGMRYNVLMGYRLLFGLLLFVPYLVLHGYILTHMGIASMLWASFGLFLVWIVAITFAMPLITKLKLDPKEETKTPTQEETQKS